MKEVIKLVEDSLSNEHSKKKNIKTTEEKQRHEK